MAFTQAPEKQTNSTERIPVALPLAQSYAINSHITYGSELLNLIPIKQLNEDGKEEVVVETRPGIKAMQVTASTLTPRGCYVWEKTAGTVYYYAACGSSVYSSTDAKVWTSVITWTAGSDPGRVGFAEYIDSTNTKSLFICDGTEGYVFTTNSAGVKITDVDFPSPHLPYPVFINGYIFLAKTNTGDIYNCALNTPLSWVAGDFISSELYPDDLVALAKINNNLLAIGKSGCEFFQDVANATGTPLARIEGGSLPFGCAHPTSIAVNKNTVTFVANDGDGDMSVKVIEGFKFKDITPTWFAATINQLIALANSSSPAEIELNGSYLRTKGGLIYSLNTANRLWAKAVPAYNHCFAYSFDTGLWFKMSSYGTGTDDYWPVFFSAGGSSIDPTNFVMGEFRGPAGKYPFFGIFGNSGIFTRWYSTFSNDQPIDDFGLADSVEHWVRAKITTPELTFGTLNRKTMSRFGICLDSPGYIQALTISWDDTGEENFTDSRTYATPDTYFKDFPFITQLGSFRKRSFQVEFTPLRTVVVKYFEVDINKGQQ